MTNYLKNKILQRLRDTFPDHEDMLTDGLGTLIVYFIYAAFVFMLLPFVLSNKWFSLVDSSKTGQIGDTIGGVMGPFIALLAAFLTFLAFWIQYRANEKQNAIARKQLDLAEQQMKMAKEQEKKYAIERFENNLYQMLDVYAKNCKAVKVGDLTGKDAFEELSAELHNTYFVLDRILRKLAMSRNYEDQDMEHQAMIGKVITLMFDDRERRLSFLTTLAYELFFYGSYVLDLNKVYYHKDEVLLANEICSKLKKTAFREEKKTSYKSQLKELTTPTEEEITCDWYTAPYPMAKGHNAQLGHYYRQMLQIIKYISDAPNELIPEQQKYEYSKFLRSQLCDAEQILLYYNSLSIMGKAWNEKHGDMKDDISTWGYIMRYRLIKNIPSNYPFFGVIPIRYYREEIKKWKDLKGESFFEAETFSCSGNSV